MREMRYAAWVVLLASTMMLSCGGDDKGKTESAPPDEVADAGPAPFTCAGEVCERPEDGPQGEFCCADRFTGGCGVMVGDECRRTTKRDDRCPAAMPPGPSGATPCCAPNGECGLDLNIGLGCTSTSQNCAVYPRQIVELLGSMTCEGETLELPKDCGVGTSSNP